MINLDAVKGIFPQTKKIYESLADEQSKKIFSNRIMYNLTNDINFIFDMTSEMEFNTDKIKQFKKLYKQYKETIELYPNSKLIIYGAGIWGKHLYELLFDLKWDCFCDKDPLKQQGTYCGLPVISPEQLVHEHREDFVVIGTRDYQDEVYMELISLGFPADHILSGDIQFQVECLLDKQYFDLPAIQPENDEVFIDAGCFNLDTSLLFKEWCNDNYKEIYAFEPDPTNYLNCKKRVEDLNVKNVKLFNAGVWSKNDVLKFSAAEGSASSLTEEGNLSINVFSLDELLDGQKATFIKMDVEGAELEALKGAKNTIVNYRPKLAICIYHKPEDILEIPLYLQSLVPDYQFYIRHYSNFTVETVLYAI